MKSAARIHPVPSAHAMGQRWLCHKGKERRPWLPSRLKASRVKRNGSATTEQNSDAGRDCLAQRKRKAGLKPGLYTGEELNRDHKGYGERGKGIQALVEKVGARKCEWPDGQAKAGRKQGEARLQI